MLGSHVLKSIFNAFSCITVHRCFAMQDHETTSQKNSKTASSYLLFTFRSVTLTS